MNALFEAWDVARAVIGVGALAVGCGFMTLGALAMARFPNFHARIHASSLTDSLGAPLSVLGLACLSPDWAGALKLLAVAAAVWLAAPVAANAMLASADLAPEDPEDRREA